MHRNVVTLCDGIDDVLQIGEVEFGRDSLSVEIERHRNQVDISSSFSACEETSLHSVRSSHETQLGGGDSGSSVVVGVEGDDDTISVFDVTTKVLNLWTNGQKAYHVGRCEGLT